MYSYLTYHDHCDTHCDISALTISVLLCFSLVGLLSPKVRLTFDQDWPHPDVPPPSAPLRAFKYTSAGGSRGGQGPFWIVFGCFWHRAGWKRNGDFDPSRMDSVSRTQLLFSCRIF